MHPCRNVLQSETLRKCEIQSVYLASFDDSMSMGNVPSIPTGKNGRSYRVKDECTSQSSQLITCMLVRFPIFLKEK
jgi:hypothetical protein